MSYDIELINPVTKETVQLDEPHQMKGGTYAIGGTTEAHLNITYNYARFFVDTLGGGGIRNIYGMSGAESIPVLELAVSKLGDDVHDDYWEPTEGNAKMALIQLIALARMRPDGVWAGDGGGGARSRTSDYTKRLVQAKLPVSFSLVAAFRKPLKEI